jgi:antitoxin CcdA
MKIALKKTKRSLNLLVDSRLLDDAKSAGLNLSAVLDRALREEMINRWASENAEAIRAYNERAESNGLWLDDFRTW